MPACGHHTASMRRRRHCLTVMRLAATPGSASESAAYLTPLSSRPMHDAAAAAARRRRLSRTWSSRCSSGGEKSIEALEARDGARTSRSCWWRRRTPPRTSPSPRTCTRSARVVEHPAAAQAARRHRQGAGRRRRARAHRSDFDDDRALFVAEVDADAGREPTTSARSRR